MYLAVTVADTTVEYQDDTPWDKALCMDICTVLIGQVTTAYTAALHITPEPEDFR